MRGPAEAGKPQWFEENLAYFPQQQYLQVYAAAKLNNFEVLEINASNPRDGQTLKQKLSGALESHNVSIVGMEKQLGNTFVLGANQQQQGGHSQFVVSKAEFAAAAREEAES